MGLKKQWSSKKDFQKDVQILINRVKRIANTENISFVGIVDIDSKIIKTDFKQERVREFDNILEKVVLENDCNPISMRRLLSDDLADGYHPNPQEHQKMFGRIRDFLVEKGVA